MTDNDGTTYRHLYCEMITTMKGQLTNQYLEILKLKFVSLLDFINFEQYSEKFPATAYELVWKSYRWHFGSLCLKTELSVTYSSDEFL
jgi:hypothetical protein